MSFGNRLKEARVNKKMTQAELARVVGVSKGAIGNYESELSSPNEPTLINLMKVLNVDANFLYQDYILPSNEQIILSPIENRLLSLFRSLSDEGKDYVLKSVEMAAATMPASKNVSIASDEKLA